MNVAPQPVVTDATASLADREIAEVERANATGRQPIIFIHGLWLLRGSWNRWSEFFEEAGYVGLAPGWPDDPATVAEANANSRLMAGKTIGQVVDHVANIANSLNRRPAIIGHSFGGLLAQILAGRGLSIATVAIDPAGFRGVLPLPFSALKSAFPILGNPANRTRAVPLTYEQFR
jgi:non-heme chloroperoxidase